MENKETVLSVKDLRINFSTDNGYVQAVRGVSFDLYKGETLCIVGESGSGKSVTNKAIMGILSKNGRVVNGSIMYEGEDLTKISEDEFHRIRGHKIGMIFQDPLSSLNPIVRIGKQITEAMLINSSRTKKMYDDLVADSLTTYRNAKTEFKNGLAKGNEDIKFLKAEKKKRVQLAKYGIYSEVKGRLYTAKQNYGSESFDANAKVKERIDELVHGNYGSKQAYREKYLEQVAAIRESSKNEIEAKERIEELTKRYKKSIFDIDVQISKAKKDYSIQQQKNAKKYDKERKEVAARKATLLDGFAKKVKEIATEYDQMISSAKTEYQQTKASLIAEYKPLIAQYKEEFKAASRVAKEKVNAYKNELRVKYLEEANAIKSRKNPYSLEEIKSERSKIEAWYKDTLKETTSTYRNSLNNCNFGDKDQVRREREKITSDYKKKCNQLKYERSQKIIASRANYVSFEAKKKSDLIAAKKKYISFLKITKEEAKQKALEIMQEVGIKDPEKRFNQYPFEFSGGMRQRIVIAIALTANPDVLICDEPTTALDVTIQAQILELINKLKKERNLSCIFITHDLGVVANMADRVAVMYAGKIVEYGLEEEIFYNPKHPYTWALLASIPDVDSNEKLEAIPGTPPNMIYPPIGDAFALRSKYAMEIDFKKEPPFFKVSDTHYAATWLLDPRAPEVEMPAIVKSRIENSLKANKKGGNR